MADQHQLHKVLGNVASSFAEAGIKMLPWIQLPLPLLALAGLGVGVAIAVSSLPGAFANLHARMKVEDKISKLPDDILFNIISRLPLCETARTSILSRRWNKIHALRNKLSFHCLDVFRTPLPYHDKARCLRYYKHLFRAAVDQTFRFFSGHKIVSVKIQCCFANEINNFAEWLDFIASLGVEELELQFVCGSSKVDTEQRFSFKFDLLMKAASLKSLHLYGCRLETKNVSDDFSSIETLDLLKVDMDMAQVPCILLYCPKLQSLKMESCKLPAKLYIFGGESLLLKFLMIKSCHGIKEIDIGAVNLRTFQYLATDHDMVTFEFSYAPKLEKFCARFDGRRTIPNVFDEISQKCPHLENLLLHTKTIDEGHCIPSTMNMFSNLRQLDLLIMVDSQPHIFCVPSILGACPRLEIFLIAAKYTSPNHQSEWEFPNKAMHHSHLKEITFGGFHGTRNEIEFASYLLRSCPILETMLIQSFYTRYQIHSRQKEKLYTPMSNANINLIYDELLGEAISRRVKLSIE